jgi:hypothetical protein
MLYSPGVESSSKTITITDTNHDGFSLLIKCAREGSLLDGQIYGTLLITLGLIYSRSLICKKLKG